MLVHQAYRCALDPSPRQVSALASHAGAARMAFDWGLALVKANLGQQAATRSYGIADHHLTPAVSWSMYALRKLWNTAKSQVAPWWADNSKEAYTTGLADDLVRDMTEVLTSFCARVYGRRSAGRRARAALRTAQDAA